MGSVMDYIECPNCKEEAFSDYYYKTGEEYVSCNHCGYHYSAQYKRDDESKYVTKDGTENYAFDNLIMEEHELKNPYGAYRVKMIGDIGTVCGSVETEEAFEGIKKAVDEMENVEYFSISRFVNGEVIKETLIENKQNGESDTRI